MSLAGLANESIAFVFPGQGSQSVGMGKTLVEKSPAARATFAEADDLLGFGLSTLAFEGSAGELEDTWNAQPAILTASVAAHRALQERTADEGVELVPIAVAGHSLGEFTALVVAEVLSFAETLALVRERGRLMKEAGTARPGGMAAVLGLDDAQLEAVCNAASSAGVVNVANANCPGQIVISGEVAALELAMDMARAAGAKRVARLGVSIASHSPLMVDASRQLRAIIDGLDLRTPAVPIVGNVSAASITTVEDLRAELAHHVERPVNWTGSVQTMIGLGATTFIELGSGTVLAGLIKRIDRDVRTVSLADLGIG